MSAVVAWLLNNPTIAGFLTLIVGAIGWGIKQRFAGRRDVRNEQAADRLDAIKDKKEKDDEVATLDPGKLDDRFDRWLRNDR